MSTRSWWALSAAGVILYLVLRVVLGAVGLDPYDYFTSLPNNDLWIAGGALLVVIVALLLLPSRRKSSTSEAKPWQVALVAVRAGTFVLVAGDLWSALVDRIWP